MTTNPLDEIQARADAATKGPWEVPHSCDPHLDKVEAPNDNNLAGSICEVRSPQQNAVFIAHAREDVPKLIAALRAVEAAHQKAPVYDTWASDCGHDDCDSVEADDGETYCPRSVVAYTCDHCAALSRDNMNGELPAWPCPTITAIREALG